MTIEPVVDESKRIHGRDGESDGVGHTRVGASCRAAQTRIARARHVARTCCRQAGCYLVRRRHGRPGRAAGNEYVRARRCQQTGRRSDLDNNNNKKRQNMS